MSFKNWLQGDGKKHFSKVSEAVASIVKEREEKETPVEEAAKFVAVTLADGVEVNVEPSFEIGATVTDMDGVSVGDGSFSLEDGTTFTVTDGAITDIVSSEETEEEMAEVVDVVPATETPAEVPAPKRTIERTEIEKMFADQKDKYEADLKARDERIATLESDSVKSNEVLNEIHSFFTALAEEPSKAPAKSTTTRFGGKSISTYRNLKSKTKNK